MRINHYTRPIARLCAAVFATACFSVSAADAPPPPGLVEAYGCTYNSGKDRGDLMAARDNLVKQAARANIDLGLAVVWHAYKGPVPIDFLWTSFHQSLTAFGATETKIQGSDAVTAAIARFDSVATCETNLGLARGIFQSRAQVNADPTFATMAACNVRAPMTMGDRADLKNHINDVLGAMDSYNNVFGFSIEPMTTNASSHDVYLFTAHDNIAGWATRTSELARSPAGQSLRRHFDATLDCTQSLWMPERVIGDANTGS